MKVVSRLALSAGLALLAAAPQSFAADSTGAFEKEIAEWRQARHDRLASPDGWLTLVGLEWLEPGENAVGSDPSNDAVIPGGPGRWGTVVLKGDALLFQPEPESGVTIGDAPAVETQLVPDMRGEPTVVRSGDISFHVIQRGSFALRVKDRRAPTLLAFEGVPVYAADPSWRIEGDFHRAPDGEVVAIANVLGQVEDSPVFGTFEFERDGRSYRLLALGTEESRSLWFLFADRTTGPETYGAGRFLYSEDMPENGRLTVDFNKAYNPHCAFNDYSTCPLPPAQNRLDLHGRAGEKYYH